MSLSTLNRPGRLALACLAMAFAAAASPIHSISTGDARWQVVGCPPVSGCTGLPVAATEGHFYSSWVAAPAGSEWVSLEDHWRTPATPGNYVFQLDLTNILKANQPTPYMFQISADNGYSVSFVANDGGQLSCAGTCSPSSTWEFNFTVLSELIDGTLTWNGVGTPVLQVTVDNFAGGSDNPTGLLIAGTAGAIEMNMTNTPDPASWEMLGTGLVAIGIYRFRRDRAEIRARQRP